MHTAPNIAVIEKRYKIRNVFLEWLDNSWGVIRWGSINGGGKDCLQSFYIIKPVKVWKRNTISRQDDIIRY